MVLKSSNGEENLGVKKASPPAPLQKRGELESRRKKHYLIKNNLNY